MCVCVSEFVGGVLTRVWPLLAVMLCPRPRHQVERLSRHLQDVEAQLEAAEQRAVEARQRATQLEVAAGVRAGTSGLTGDARQSVGGGGGTASSSQQLVTASGPTTPAPAGTRTHGKGERVSDSDRGGGTGRRGIAALYRREMGRMSRVVELRDARIRSLEKELALQRVVRDSTATMLAAQSVRRRQEREQQQRKARAQATRALDDEVGFGGSGSSSDDADDSGGYERDVRPHQSFYVDSDDSVEGGGLQSRSAVRPRRNEDDKDDVDVVGAAVPTLSKSVRFTPGLLSGRGLVTARGVQGEEFAASPRKPGRIPVSPVETADETSGSSGGSMGEAATAATAAAAAAAVAPAGGGSGGLRTPTGGGGGDGAGGSSVFRRRKQTPGRGRGRGGPPTMSDLKAKLDAVRAHYRRLSKV